MITKLALITLLATVLTLLFYIKRKAGRKYFALFVAGVVLVVILVITIGFLVLLERNGQYPFSIFP